MKEDKYTKSLAKNQICAMIDMRDIGKNVFPKFLEGFSHDVTKIQTKKQSIFLSFYFYEVLQHLKTFIYTNFRFQRVLRFAIEDS